MAESKTILIVDDEPMVLELVRVMLSSEGYGVLAADSGAKALQIFHCCGANIHLLLTDVLMPQMSGPELVGHLRALRPDLPVLYITGCGPEGLVTGDSRSNLLRKPFDAVSLVGAVRQIVEAEHHGSTR